LGHRIRSKLILFTVLPVLAVYLAMLWLGLSYVGDYVRSDAQRWLAEHTRHQASRLAMALSRAPALAEGIGDLVVADPDQDQALLYAHLIDGLRRTPIARSAGLSYGNPPRNAQMRRGSTPQFEPESGPDFEPLGPGWHLLDDALRYERRILRRGLEIGFVWVELSLDEVYAAIGVDDRETAVSLLSHEDGRMLWPSLRPPAFEDLAPLLRNTVRSGAIQAVATPADGREFWFASAILEDTPLRMSAAIPADTALAVARRESVRLAVALLVSLLAIVLAIGVVARQITRPLATLDASVRQIARGDFAVAPEVASNDELGALARVIHTMAGRIAEREQELRNAQAALEQRVQKRTAALQASNLSLINQIEETRATQEALQRANEQAERASRAKSEFLSNMTHELRTPLHGVLGYTQILLREPDLNAAQRGGLVAIERCGQHLLTLINDILDMSRIEAGQMLVDEQPTDLAELLNDVHTIVAQRAAGKGLELNLDIAADTPARILTDGLKLRQILLNLLGNAIKFTDQGRITLGVSRAGEHDLWFEVRDTGVGIAGEHLESIFEAFHQVREGQAIDGTGLGLAINQRLIKLLGGDAMQVESTPGHGSRFRFRLPCRPAAVASGPQLPAPTAVETAATTGPAPDVIAQVALAALAGGLPLASMAAPAGWPPDLARRTADRIDAALELGDVASLFQLAEELADDPGAPGGDVGSIAGLAGQFDFEGLRRFAGELRQAAAGAGATA
jgi:signal transduction histidine kinase